MRNRRNQSNDSGVVRTLGYMALMAIIVVKTLQAVMNTIVKTVDGINESRRHRRV